MTAQSLTMKRFPPLLRLLVVVAIVTIAVPAHAQTVIDSTRTFDEPDTLVLDLYRSVAIALGESPDAFYSQVNVDQSYISFRSSALNLYSPQINADLLAPSYQQSLSEQLVFDPTEGRTVREWVESENERMQGTLNIDQPLPTGGQLRLESNFYRRFYSSDLTGDENDLEYSTTYRASFTQELLRGNLRRYAKEQSEIAYEQTLLNSIQTRRGLVFNVLESYYGLLASYRELEISRDDLSANRETADLARRKYEAGLIPEVETLQLEVEAARVETDLLSSESSFETQLDRFRNLLGIPLDKPVRVVGNPTFDTLDVDLQQAIDKALEKREEMRLAELQLEQAELSLKDARRPWHIGGEITAFYNLDLRTNSIDNVLSDRLDDYATNRGLAFNVNIPLFGGGRKDLDIQSARLALRRAEFDARQTEKDVVLDVRSAVRSLREARQRYEIALRSLEIAEKSFEISRQRFENGQITARDWIDAQISVNRSRINASRSLMDHNTALARYRLTVGEPVLPGVVVRSLAPDPDL